MEGGYGPEHPPMPVTCTALGEPTVDPHLALRKGCLPSTRLHRSTAARMRQKDPQRGSSRGSPQSTSGSPSTCREASRSRHTRLPSTPRSRSSSPRTSGCRPQRGRRRRSNRSPAPGSGRPSGSLRRSGDDDRRERLDRLTYARPLLERERLRGAGGPCRPSRSHPGRTLLLH
jgi:hypothetical protein